FRDAEIIRRPDRTPAATHAFVDRQLERAVEYLRSQQRAARPVDVAALNSITGDVAMRAAIQSLTDDAENTPKLLAAAAKPTKEKKPPFKVNAALILAETARNLKQADASEQFFRMYLDRAVKLQSGGKSLQAYRRLLALYAESNKPAESEKLIREFLAAADATKPADVLKDLVGGLAQQKKFDEARQVVDQFLKVQPENWFFISLKATVQNAAGDHEPAARTYEDALAKALADNGQNKEARTAAAKQFHYTLSGIYAGLKQVDKAAEHLKALL